MKSVLLFVIILFTTGCAPLCQAPLVYSSRQTLGVHLSVTNPETPGASMDVGFNNKDMAIVPVAVAKLPKGLGGDGDTGDIALVNATYSGSMDPNSISDATTDLRLADDELKKVSASLKVAQDNLDDFSKKESVYDISIKQLEQFANEIKAIDELPINAEDKSQAEDQRKKKDDKQREFDSTKAKIEELDAEYFFSKQKIRDDKKTLLTKILDDAKKAKDEADNRQKVATKKLEKVEGKKDAYSVFGSFDSGTSMSKSNNASAGVTFGKMFSTGVAAQNVSQGVQESTNYLARKACLDSLHNTVPEGVTAAQAAQMCGAK